MFLFKQALVREACIFNLMNTAHQQAYNAMLAQEGKTLFIQKRKEWGVQGFVAPDMEADYDPEGPPPFITKSDSFYVYVEYNKTPHSPWRSPNRAELYQGDVLVDGLSLKKMVSKTIDVEAEEVEGDDNHVVIDITDRVARAKPVRAKGRKKPKTAKEAINKAIAKHGDLVKKQVSKAKTVEEKIDIATKAAARQVQSDANDEAMANLKDIARGIAGKAAKEITAKIKKEGGRGGMVGYLADELRANPKHARGIIGTLLAKNPERFPGLTVDTFVSKLLAEDNGVAKAPENPNWKKIDPKDVDTVVRGMIDEAGKAKKKGGPKPPTGDKP